MEYLTKIREMQENKNYDYEEIQMLADEIEEIVSSSELWQSVKDYFSSDELLDFLEYIATNYDI